MEESTYISIEREELKMISVGFKNWVFANFRSFGHAKTFYKVDTDGKLFDIFYKEYNAKKYKESTKQ